MPIKYITLTKDHLDTIISHCMENYPYEACGILAGKADLEGNIVEKVYKMKNTEKSHVSYLIDPMEQFDVVREMRNDGTEMVGIFHSHPQSEAYPSLKDMDLAYYPDSIYVIVSLAFKEPKIRAFSIEDRKVEEVEIRIRD